MATDLLKKENLSGFFEGLKEPAWLLNSRKKAFAKSEFPGLPSRDNESWRKIDLSGLDLNSFNYTDNKSQYKIVEKPESMSVVDVSKSLPGNELEPLIQDMFMTNLDQSGNTNFFHAAMALSTHTFFLQAKKIESKPIFLRHDIGTGNTLIHNTLISVTDNAKLVVVEEFQGHSSDNFCLWNSLTSAIVEENGELQYIILGNFTDCEYHFHNFDVRLGRNARVKVVVVNIGGFCGKSFYKARLLEPGGEYKATGLTAGAGYEFNDTEMHVDHQANHTMSQIQYKTVLNEQAHHIFNGNLFIPKGIKDASSRQINHNLLLSRKARAESMPNLIIKSEDVSCEHGATMGELNTEAIFYLMSRGLSEPDARKLLIDGFIRDAVREIPLEELHENILLAIRKKISF